MIEQNGKWMYNLGSSDIWNNGEFFDTKEEAASRGIEEAKESGIPLLYVGQVEGCSGEWAANFLSADALLQNIAENVWDDAGEVGEDYLEAVKSDHLDALEVSLKDVVKAWMEEYGYTPNFYRIINNEQVPIV